MVVNNDGGKGGGGITSPPHPRQVLSAHFIYFPARDLFNGFLTRPLETLRDAPSFSLMLLLLFKRSDCMHKVLTCIYVVNTSWTNCLTFQEALLTSWPSWLILSQTVENCLSLRGFRSLNRHSLEFRASRGAEGTTLLARAFEARNTKL